MKAGSIHFEELSIASIAASKSALLASIDQHDVVSVDIDADASRVDVAGVQLVISARHYAEMKTKSVRLASPAQGALLEVLKSAGFLDTVEDRAFWLHRENIQ
ncbi:MAG: hypothetical protein NW223_02755 [Hyphomicrobiaceae bacterium]|nr:hypothetical protein [Hyphomicrobiaceae bacterium]